LKGDSVLDIQKPLAFAHYQSKFVDTERLEINGDKLSIRLVHSNTKSAYIKLFEGVLNRECLHVSLSCKKAGNLNFSRSKVYIQVDSRESLEDPVVYQVDPNSKTVDFEYTPQTSWETTEISVFFENVTPPQNGAGLLVQLDFSGTCTAKYGHLDISSDAQFSRGERFAICQVPSELELGRESYAFRIKGPAQKGLYRASLILKSRGRSQTFDLPIDGAFGSAQGLLHSGRYQAFMSVVKNPAAEFSIRTLEMSGQGAKQQVNDGLDLGICSIIPTHNCAQYLERSVASLVGQSMRPRAIYIIDDGSTDGTQSLISSLQSKYLGSDILISSLRLPSNRGPYFSKNLVISKVRGMFDYYALQDADDYSDPERFTKQVNALVAGGGAVAYSYGKRVCGGSVVLNRGLEARRMYAGGMFTDAYFDIYGYFEAAMFGADDEMYQRSLKIESRGISVLKDPLYFAESREGSLTQVQSADPLRQAYTETYSQRYDPKDTRLSFKSPLYTHASTPREMRSFREITVHLATYPPRLESLIRVLKEISPTLRSLDAHLVLCFNEVSEVPQEVTEALRHVRATVHTPTENLKDNGKFIGVAEGVNFWIDDDIQYSRAYFEYLLMELAKLPKNTALSLHGLRGTDSYGPTRDVLHFESLTPNFAPTSTAGTGVLAMDVGDAFVAKALNDIARSSMAGMVDLLFGLECAKLNIPILNIARSQTLAVPHAQLGGDGTLFQKNRNRAKKMDHILTIIRNLREMYPWKQPQV
jgi:hypothetical protein